MSIRELFNRLRAGDSSTESPAGYREPAPVRARDAVLDLEAAFQAMRMRVRALERQLQHQGIAPAPAPSARELFEVADILDRCARCDSPGRNTVELRYLAVVIRGLATWREE